VENGYSEKPLNRAPIKGVKPLITAGIKCPEGKNSVLS